MDATCRSFGTHEICPTELDVLSDGMSGAEQSRVSRAVSSITPWLPLPTMGDGRWEMGDGRRV